MIRYITLFCLALLTAFGCANDSSSDKLVNVILINIDDLGWADLSVQGSTYYETPHIDGLASAGIRFTDAYAAASVCSPTRSAIMTGRYPARIGITDWIRSEFQEGTIPEDRRNPTEYVVEPDKKLQTPPNPLWMEHDEVTVAEVLKEAGYTSAHIGKWHLGTEDWYPETQGFDINIGGTDFGQPPSFFDPYYNESQGYIENLQSREEGEYLTDREADEAIKFIRDHQDSPFFLHLAHYAVHTPIQAKQELIARFEAKPTTNQKDSEYAAMVYSVDQAVGRIVHELKNLELIDHTLIIFTSDNGGLIDQNGDRYTDNAPLRSGKGYPYEGGIRVPLIISWPQQVEPAQVSYQPVLSIDLMPTIIEAAGAQMPPDRQIDGLSLLSHITTDVAGPLDREELIWHFPHYRVGLTIRPYSIIRSGNWKLIRWWEGPGFELYNLREDIGEQNNLADEMPDKVNDLNALLLEKLRDMDAKLPKENPEYEGAIML